MKQLLDIQPRHLSLVKDILLRYLPPSATVYAFGSRATGNAKKFSDLDLVIDDEKRLDSSIITHIAFDLEASSLPFKVDVIDWHTISESFQHIIAADRIILLQGCR